MKIYRIWFFRLEDRDENTIILTCKSFEEKFNIPTIKLGKNKTHWVLLVDLTNARGIIPLEPTLTPEEYLRKFNEDVEKHQ